MKTHTLWFVFAIVDHTKTIENSDEDKLPNALSLKVENFQNASFWKTRFLLSEDRWKWFENASVDENILLRFRRHEHDESGDFWKLISVDGTLI